MLKKKHIYENFPSHQKVFAKKQLEQRELLNHQGYLHNRPPERLLADWFDINVGGHYV